MSKQKVRELRVTGPDEHGSMYIYVKRRIGPGSVERTIERRPPVMLDYDTNGDLIGIEILGVSERVVDV